MNIYDSGRGDGFSFYRESYEVEDFSEYRKSILDTYSRAESEGIIELISEEGPRGEELTWVWCEDEIKHTETSTTVEINNKRYNLFGCLVYGQQINFPEDAEYVAFEWDNSCKGDLGSLDFDPEELFGEELIEKLFNFYLTKA